MTGPEFAELVETIQEKDIQNLAHWQNSPKLYDDFRDLPADDVWSALYLIFSDVEQSKWPIKPMHLRAVTIDMIRHKQPVDRPALPEVTGGGSYAKWSQETFGEVLPIGVAIRRRHERLADCRSPHCDIHRAIPIEGGLAI